jgi:hypothetical protein
MDLSVGARAASNIQHPTSNFQLPTPNAQRPTPNAQDPGHYPVRELCESALQFLMVEICTKHTLLNEAVL